MPQFDYCSHVWDCLSGYLSDKLQKLQNRDHPLIRAQTTFSPSSLGEAISSTKETQSLNGRFYARDVKVV